MLNILIGDVDALSVETTMAAEMSAMKADLGRDLQRETSRLKKEHKRETEVGGGWGEGSWG